MTPHIHAAWTHRPTDEQATVCGATSTAIEDHDLSLVTCPTCQGTLDQMGVRR